MMHLVYNNPFLIKYIKNKIMILTLYSNLHLLYEHEIYKISITV